MTTPLDMQPLLRTKLYPASLPAGCVSRGRLLSLLDQATNVPLTVISAPAGYGKSVLVSEWLGRIDRQSMWLSLDKTDSDVRQFLAYLSAGIQAAAKGALQSLDELLQAAELAPVQVLAANLVNGLDKLLEPLVVVLDDFDRLASNSQITELLSLWLEHPPTNLNLIIISRRGVPLPLSRLRAANQLVEIRVQDLRFSISETAAFMGAAVNIALTEKALHRLEEEIEGWPVGLRLVALMIKRLADPNVALENLSGGIPQTQDYMLQEVLAGLATDVKDCLLKSSILGRFSAELLDAVCFSGRSAASSKLDGAAFIRELSRLNLFAYSLDSYGQWYRYHHLFQFMLDSQLQLAATQDTIRDIHLRAANWFTSHGEPDEAITHYIAADESGCAADVIAQNVQDILESNRWFIVDRWLAILPEAVRLRRVDMQIAQAWVGFCKLDTELVEESLQRAEQLYEAQAAPNDLAQQFSFLRGWLAFWGGDLDRAQSLMRQAMDGFSVAPGMIAGEVRSYLSLAMAMTGKYSEALQFLAKERLAAGRAAGTPYLVRLIGGQANLCYLSGNLDGATAAVGRMRLVNRFKQHGYAVGWATYLNGLQDFSRGNFDSARAHFADAEQHINILERRVSADVLAGSVLALELSGRRQQAAKKWIVLDQFVRNYEVAECLWIVEATAARMALLNNPSSAILDWARSVAVPQASGLELMFWLINPSLTQARVLVMAGEANDIKQGLAQLDELLAQCLTFNNYCQEIAIRPLRAVALCRLGREAEALAGLSDAVILAAPGNWRQPFIELGEVVTGLLVQLETTPEHKAFVEDVLQVILAAKSGENASAPTNGSAPLIDRSATTSGVLESEGLTNRELDILECLEQRLQNKEIAAQLFISPHMVGYHLKHIYQKLDVKSRRHAVQKARAMGMLSPR